jgi:superfamily II DNA or RNA helicase
MPTGTGKTRAFCSLARHHGDRTLVCVHRDELARQTADTLSAVWPGATVGLVQAERNEWQGYQVVIATVQTLCRRTGIIPADLFDLLVLDEAHHSAADTWRAVAEHFRARFRLGCTATPDRLDGKGLDDLFGPEPLYVYELRAAIDDGFLVPIRQYAIHTGVSLDGVATRGGDFAPEALGKAVLNAARTRAVVEAYQERAGGRKAIAFCVNLSHVAQMVEALTDAGVPSESITGEMATADRRRVLDEFRRGAFRVLVGCEVLTEGYDERTVSCVLMARPTQSRGLYQQMLGRGLRLCPEAGKLDCLVLDVVDNCRKHPLVTATSLLGAQAADANGLDIRDVIAAEEGAKVKADEYAARAFRVQAPWEAEEVDPFGRNWGAGVLGPYQATQRWHLDPATEKQVAALRRRGYSPPPGLTKGEAAHVLDRPTPKQRNLLARRGLWHDNLRFDDARGIIDQLAAAEGWR